MPVELKDRIGRRIKLRDLHILLAVAERGSLAKAAKDLAVSPPVISKAISDLEAEIGVRLFDRDRHGAVPTSYGRVLLNRGIAAFDELRLGLREIEALGDPSAGEVRIGGLAAMMAGLLPKIVGDLRIGYPRLSFCVTQILTTPDVYDHLRDRTFDLIVGRLPDRPLDDDLVSEALFEESVAIVVGRTSPWATRRKMSLSDLLSEAWILPQPGTQVGSLVRKIFSASGFDLPAAPVICSSIEFYWAPLATGKFVAALPLSVLRFAPQRNVISVLPIKAMPKAGPVGIITLRDRTRGPAVDLVFAKARELSIPLREGA